MPSIGLHIRTILYLIGCGSLLLGAGLIVVKRLVKHEPALDDWIRGSLLLAGGYFLAPLHDPETAGMWTVASNLIVLAGYGRYWQGTRRFVGLKPLPGAEAALLALAAIGLVYHAIVVPSLPGQILVMALAIAVLAWSNAWHLGYGPWRIAAELRWVLIGLSVVWGFVQLLRAAAALDWVPSGPYLEQGGPMRGVTEMVLLAMQSALTVLLPLMIVARVHEHRLAGAHRLRAREAQLRTFIEHAPAAIAMFDPHMNYLAASRRWIENHRLEGLEIVGRNHYDTFPDMPARWRAAHERALAGIVERCERDRVRHADGSADWVRWELRPWHAADGRIGGVLLCSEIITEQVELMASLQRHHEHLEDLVAERTAQIERQSAEIADLYNRAPCGYHSLDAGGKVIAINDAELAMLGYTREEVVGRMNVRQLLAPGGLDAFESSFERLRRAGALHDEEFDFQRKDGSVLPVIVGANVVRGADGAFRYCRAVVVDNTARRRADTALRETSARLKLALEVTRVVVCHQGRDLRYTWIANSSFGLTAETVIGRRDEDLFDGAGATELTAFKCRVLTTGEPARREFWVTRGGRSRCFDLIADPTRDAAGAVSGVICAAADITDRKQMEEALLESNIELEARVIERTRALRELTVDAALAEERERQAIARDLHDDLGQLLHVAKIKLDTLARMVVDPRGLLLAREIDALVGDASARIRSLTAQLCPPVLENLGLVPALGWLAEEMERVYGLVVEVDDDGLPKPVSPAQAIILYRATRELLINVFKHAKSPFATVETRREDDALVLRVIDDGAGLADPGVAAATGGGRGFGLASVRERMGYLNGGMCIASQPGVGTVVELRLPFTVVDEAAKEDVA